MARKVWIKRIYYDKPSPPRTLVRSDYILREKDVAAKIVKDTHDGRERAIYFEYAKFYVSLFKNVIRFFRNKYVITFLITLFAGIIVFFISRFFK